MMKNYLLALVSIAALGFATAPNAATYDFLGEGNANESAEGFGGQYT